MADRSSRVVLVIGSCGLDRLLTVPSYPTPDSKVRTTAYHEVGGGNAANTAAAMGRLKNAAFLQGQNLGLQIRILTKLGDDAVGQQLLDELQASEVDVSSPFLIRPPGTTTAFTTIIVSQDNHTRTCLHTPGSCGELQIEDLQDMEAIFHNVVHLHSDSRHTDASLFLAKEAKRRGIPVSCDSEKDRKTKALDELMLLSDSIFTNSNYLKDYLGRLHSEYERENNRQSLEGRQLVVLNQTDLGRDTEDKIAKSMTPSAFFTRWTDQNTKQVIVTQGQMGALHFTQTRSSIDSTPVVSSSSNNNAAITKGPESAHSLDIHHDFSDTIDGQHVLIHSSYKVETAGVLKEVAIVDSTGAGDAFIAGFLMASLVGDNRKFALDFGSWVAGQKLQGPGARSALPWGEDVDSSLGIDVVTMERNLNAQLTSFNGEPSLALPI